MTAVKVNPFNMKAEGGARAGIDREAVAEALRLLADPAAGIQLQGFPSKRYRIHKGDDIEGLLKTAESLSDGEATYYTLHPVSPAIERCANNKSALYRRWLLIDVDVGPQPAKLKKGETPVPKEARNATEEEKRECFLVAYRVRIHLDDSGWPEPIRIDSGNGEHLLYRIDLPNNAYAQAVCKAVLHRLSEQFDSLWAHVDLSVHDARRLSKLPGTWARKGPHSEERPHRMARLCSAPDVVEVVTAGQLQAIAMPPTGEPEVPDPPAEEQREATHDPPPKPPPGRDPFDLYADSGAGDEDARRRAYARAALAKELADLATTGAARNIALNKAAFALGQFVVLGLLDEAEVVQGLRAACATNGLDRDTGGTRGVEATIRSGLEAGKGLPREIPEAPPEVNGQHKKKRKADAPPPPPPPSEPLTVCLANVEPLAVDWLMPNRLPKCFVSVLAGRTGIGKSFVALDIVARVTTGGPIPLATGGECFEQGGALIISEDPHEYILAPRLIEAGADMRRVRAMTWKAMGSYRLQDSAMLDRACAEVDGAKVVIIDPPTNFLGDVDEHKNSEVRQTVMRVVEWVSRMGLACIFILHVNKNSGNGVDALSRVMGSVAWVTTSRIAHGFTVDPDDGTRCLWVPLKNNLGPLGKALAYRVVKTDVLARVEWLEEVDTSADAAMRGEKKGKPKRNIRAAAWLEEIFAATAEIPSKEVWSRKDDETTISTDALKEAKDLLGIKARQVVCPDGGRMWMWIWPPDAKARWQEGKGDDSQ